ncbi:MAG: tRNA uridine-5-carboxymethylaminomethyl(34) synthesis GTPase MnmE [Anaerolineae bacterium]|nr:tRNA uridine-5-carboxymethylaminomethyl(34) synthesis GTPase MnmE [Anaerolineales bacterium]MCQ3976484.1 tRNA uridine-5-carboxymethylaminomethyl(34) synthesis GTPase MnmE [Anaerolineae bacterium]
MYSLDDTIAAIATSIGQSGVGIVKLSGPEAYPIAHRLFRSAVGRTNFQPYRLHYGQIVEPDSGATVDEALVVYMPKPRSYTRQDVVEIQAHGGLVPLRRIFQLTLSLGARPAEAGEMTLRAFLNGRLDLAQAEAVLDVIEAKTEAALRVANEQLSGSLSAQVADVRRALLDTLAFLEASIDFVEDEIPFQDVVGPLREVGAQLEKLLHSADQGLIYRQGVRAAIVGRPNVGKSSLLNALLRGDRAIVTAIPGTTRDTLEETANIGGIPVVLVDTAGIRAETADEVERIGVERSRAALARADIALMVVDGSQRLEIGDWEIEGLVGQKPALLVVNKNDLPAAQQVEPPADFLPAAHRVRMSALTNEGIETLEAAIVELVTGGSVTLADTPLVSNPRHKALLQRALSHTQAAITAQQDGLSPDLVSIDVRAAVDALGEITGETATEDLLDTIFSKFCIGK